MKNIFTFKMIKIAGIVMSVVIGMGAATATFADLGDVTTTIDAGVTSTFVETQEWVPNTYTAADGTTSYTQVSEGSDSYSNGSGGFSLKTDLDALTGLTFNTGSASVQTQITGDVTLSGTVITFANGATLDLASINTDTFASISGTVITFANGSTFDVASVDTNTFVTFGNTGQVFSADGTAGINLTTDAELAAAILAAVGLASTGSDAATGLNLAVETNTAGINTLNSADVTAVLVGTTLTITGTNGDTAVIDLASIDTDTNTQLSDSEVRALISVSGSLSYNATTGVLSFTERSDSTVQTLARNALSVSGDLSYNSTTGVISFSQRADSAVTTLAVAAIDAALGTSGSITAAINAAIALEVTARNTAISNAIASEVTDRNAAILVETNARTAADDLLSGRIGVASSDDGLGNVVVATGLTADVEANASDIADLDSSKQDVLTAAQLASFTAQTTDTNTFASISGTVVTFANGNTFDIASVDTDTNTFASISGTVVTFADGSTFDIATVDTNTFASISGSVITFVGGSTFDIASVDTNTQLSNAQVRALISVAAGGSLSYDSATGVLSFTERSDSTVQTLARTALSVTGDISYNSATGVISFTQRTDSAVTVLADASATSKITAALLSGGNIEQAIGASLDLAIGSVGSVATQADVTAGLATAVGDRFGQSGYLGGDADLQDQINALTIAAGGSSTTNATAITALESNLGVASNGTDAATGLNLDVETNTAAIATEVADRIAAITQEVTDRNAAILVETNARIAADNAAAASDLTARGVIQSDVDANETASDLADAALSGRSDALEGAVFIPAVERVFGQITLFGSLVYTEQPNGTWTNSGGGVISNDNIVNFYHDPINAPYDIVPVAYVAPQSIVAANAADISQEITARVNAIATLSGQAAHSFTYNSTTGLVTVLAVDGTNLGSFQAGHTFSNLDNGTGAVSEGFATDAQVAAAIAGIESDISTATAAQLTLDTAQRTDIDANTASIGSVGSAAVLGVFTSSANVVYTQDATDGKFYTPGNNFGYSQSVVQSWIDGGDGSWTVEAVAAVDADGLRGDIADETTARIAADTAATTDRAAIRSEFAAADAALQADINANESASDTADTTLQSNIDSEQAARIAADTAVAAAATDALEAAVLALNNAIKDAKDAQDILEAAQNGSIADNSAAISAEVTRATAAESVIQSDVDANEAASIAADVALNVRVDTNAADLVAETVARIQFETKQAIVDAVQNGRLDTIEGILIDHESRISALEALHVVDKSFSKVIDGPNGTKIVMHFDADGTMRGKARTLTFLENPVIHGEMDILWNDQGKAVNAITGKLVDANTGLPMADKVEAEVKLEAAYVAAELQSDTRFGTSIEADVVVEAKVAAPVITQSEMNAEIAKFQTMFSMPVVESVAVEMPVAKAAVVEMVAEEVVVIDEAKSLAASVADLFSGMFSSKTEVKAEVKVTEKSPMNVGNPFGK